MEDYNMPEMLKILYYSLHSKPNPRLVNFFRGDTPGGPVGSAHQEGAIDATPGERRRSSRYLGTPSAPASATDNWLNIDAEDLGKLRAFCMGKARDPNTREADRSFYDSMSKSADSALMPNINNMPRAKRDEFMREFAFVRFRIAQLFVDDAVREEGGIPMEPLPGLDNAYMRWAANGNPDEKYEDPTRYYMSKFEALFSQQREVADSIRNELKLENASRQEMIQANRDANARYRQLVDRSGTMEDILKEIRDYIKMVPAKLDDIDKSNEKIDATLDQRLKSVVKPDDIEAILKRLEKVVDPEEDEKVVSDVLRAIASSDNLVDQLMKLDNLVKSVNDNVAKEMAAFGNQQSALDWERAGQQHEFIKAFNAAIERLHDLKSQNLSSISPEMNGLLGGIRQLIARQDLLTSNDLALHADMKNLIYLLNAKFETDEERLNKIEGAGINIQKSLAPMEIELEQKLAGADVDTVLAEQGKAIAEYNIKVRKSKKKGDATIPEIEVIPNPKSKSKKPDIAAAAAKARQKNKGSAPMEDIEQGSTNVEQEIKDKEMSEAGPLPERRPASTVKESARSKKKKVNSEVSDAMAKQTLEAQEKFIGENIVPPIPTPDVDSFVEARLEEKVPPIQEIEEVLMESQPKSPRTVTSVDVFIINYLLDVTMGDLSMPNDLELQNKLHDVDPALHALIGTIAGDINNKKANDNTGEKIRIMIEHLSRQTTPSNAVVYLQQAFAARYNANLNEIPAESAAMLRNAEIAVEPSELGNNFVAEFSDATAASIDTYTLDYFLRISTAIRSQLDEAAVCPDFNFIAVMTSFYRNITEFYKYEASHNFYNLESRIGYYNLLLDIHNQFLTMNNNDALQIPREMREPIWRIGQLVHNLSISFDENRMEGSRIVNTYGEVAELVLEMQKISHTHAEAEYTRWFQKRGLFSPVIKKS